MPENSPAWLERTALLVGGEALQAMKRATVVVAGLGGVGAYAAEMTARAGVGRMIIIDSDKVSESNRNRQLLALCSTVGRPKTEVMAERLLDINPELQIIKVEEYLTEDNVAALVERSCAEAGVARPDPPCLLDGSRSQIRCHESPSDRPLEVLQLPSGLHSPEETPQDWHQQGLPRGVLGGTARP